MAIHETAAVLAEIAAERDRQEGEPPVPDHTYRAIFEINDVDRPISALVAEASAAIDAMAAKDGARLTGQPQWTVAGERLICEAPAEPTIRRPKPWRLERQQRDLEVLRLAAFGWSHRQIASTLALPPSTVRDVIARDRRVAA